MAIIEEEFNRTWPYFPRLFSDGSPLERLYRNPAQLQSLCALGRATVGCRVLAKNLPLTMSRRNDRKVPRCGVRFRQPPTNLRRSDGVPGMSVYADTGHSALHASSIEAANTADIQVDDCGRSKVPLVLAKLGRPPVQVLAMPARSTSVSTGLSCSTRSE